MQVELDKIKQTIASMLFIAATSIINDNENFKK